MLNLKIFGIIDSIISIIITFAFCSTILFSEKNEKARNTQITNEELSKEILGEKSSEIPSNIEETEIINKKALNEDSSVVDNNKDKQESFKSNSKTNNVTINDDNSKSTTNQQKSTIDTQSQFNISQEQYQLTEWEKIGITQYQYENEKLFSWEEISYKNIETCMNEAKTINEKYDFSTRYGYTSGKYINNVGCWVEITVNDTNYYLNEFKKLGY